MNPSICKSPPTPDGQSFAQTGLFHCVKALTLPTQSLTLREK